MADKTAQQNTPTLVKASARSLRISPRKMRLVTNLVKNMRVSDALTQLQFTNKKGAEMMSKLLRSAVANAEHNFSLNADNLFIKSATCDMGQTLRRMMPRARGSAFVIRRKMAHVNVVLEERAAAARKKSRFAIPKPEKAKAEPVEKDTTPEETQNPAETPAPNEAETNSAEKHYENDDATVREKAGPENQLK